MPSSCVKNQLDLHHWFLERPFLSLLFFVLSFFSNSSKLGQSSADYTLNTFLHIPVFWECSGSDLWYFGSNLDHWHFVDSKSTRWMLTKRSSRDFTYRCSASMRLLNVLDLRPFSFGSGRGCKWSRLTSIPLRENCVMTKKTFVPWLQPIINVLCWR